MKKLFALLLMLLFVVGNAFAEQQTYDFSAMTDEEIESFIDAATAEMKTRKADAASESDSQVYEFPCVVLDTGEYKLEILAVNTMEYDGTTIMMCDVRAENSSEYDIEIDMSFESVGDWDVRNVTTSESIQVTSGKNAQAQMSFYFFNMTNLDFEKFEFEVSVWDKGRLLFNLYKSNVLNGTFVQ